MSETDRSTAAATTVVTAATAAATAAFVTAATAGQDQAFARPEGRAARGGRLRRGLGAASVAAVLGLGAAACGGSDTNAQLDSWAKSVCGGIAGPIQSVQLAQDDTGRIVPGETPLALRTRLAADMGKLATGNQQIAQAVQAAGAPKTSDGAQTQAAAVSELNQAAGGYSKVQVTLNALPVTDQARFAAGLRGVSDQVQQLSTLSSSARQRLQSGDLGAALNRQSACAAPSGAPTAVPSAPDSAAATASTSPKASSSAKSSKSASPKPSGSAH